MEGRCKGGRGGVAKGELGERESKTKRQRARESESKEESVQVASSRIEGGCKTSSGRM